MAEFKFACPVCGQHITADSGNAGSAIECPTCYRKIVVPQAPASDASKLILSAAEVGRSRPVAMEQAGSSLRRPSSRGRAISLIAGTLVFALVATAAFWVARKSLLGGRAAEEAARTVGQGWKLDLTGVTIPDLPVGGRIHGRDFDLTRATLQGGNLTLRQGPGWPPELGVSVILFARRAEDLSGQTIEISAERPRSPRVVLRWKENEKAVTETFTSGYALRIEFGQAAGGRMPGKIYLSAPDELRSYVAGAFNAEIRKPATQQPRTGTQQRPTN